jgi:UDP-glucose:(heptosyl)LPS alpha-1,3-glucosyltransferase
MKLAFCIFKYFPYGGLQQDMLRIAAASLVHGHEVDVFTMSWEGENELSLNVRLIDVKTGSNHQRAKEYIKAVENELSNYDLVVGFNKIPGLDWYFSGDVCFQFSKRSKPFFYRWTARYKTFLELESDVFSLESNTKIMVLTEQQKRDYQACYQTPDERFHLVPPGIETNELSPREMKHRREELREAMGISEEYVVMLFIASSFKTKGLDYAVAALSMLSDPRVLLVVIGDDKKRTYQRLAAKLAVEDRIFFVGPQPDVRLYMLAADMLINPARVESAGMAIIEALTMGLPVILPDHCGYAMHVQQADAGVILPSQFELQDLATAMQDSIDLEKRKRWAQNALHYVANTDLYSLGDKAIDLFEGKA